MVKKKKQPCFCSLYVCASVRAWYIYIYIFTANHLRYRHRQ